MSPGWTRPRISRVEAYELVVPIVPARGDARGAYGARRTLVVRARSADGVQEGWGQAGWPVGAVPEQVRSCAEALVAGAALPVVAHEVAAAFDLASADLAGRIAGLSLAEMLGGVRRPRVLVYASIHNYGEGLDAETEALEGLRAARAEGFGGMKVKVGAGEVEDEIRWLERVRSLAPGMALMADANQTYDRDQALRMGQALAALDFVWFEEPIPREDLEGYRWLAERLTIPLAGGEDCEGAQAVEAWARTGATSIVQANVARIGGISALAETMARASAHAEHFAVHCWNAPLLHVATLQCLAAMPEPSVALDSPVRWYSALETTTLPVPAPMITSSSKLMDGRVELPNGPGFGVEIDVEFVRAHAASTLAVGR